MSGPDSYGALREQSHERVYQLWQAAKVSAESEGDDARLVQALRDHPEYYEVWEHANEFLQEQAAIDGVNPFLHVVMHAAIENEAIQDDPPEVRAVLESKTSNDMQRHQAVHVIANVFAQCLYQALHTRERFDNDAYRRKLDKLLPRSRNTWK